MWGPAPSLALSQPPAVRSVPRQAEPGGSSHLLGSLVGVSQRLTESLLLTHCREGDTEAQRLEGLIRGHTTEQQLAGGRQEGTVVKSLDLGLRWIRVRVFPSLLCEGLLTPSLGLFPEKLCDGVPAVSPVELG